ncbi:hypothetical protein EGT71_16020 [Atlantibacter subterranea]|uniref:Uncharacterized protein n=1 Tax=Atlantibacter subterraneus TaxID=255519 RepID=A0A3R9EI97_9ENTR|nr:hypothetical protein EGK67_14450 [Atlantibacter subterranea]RSE07181.1 hypothetical protein EGT84_07385 [Atlantibacter subterranea]RSE24099.1 hypothetical protein EGT71_16020 [Atlantibacter subterranea]
MNLPRLCGLAPTPISRGHSKSRRRGFAFHTRTSHSPSQYPFRIGTQVLRTCFRGNLNYCINMMSRVLIQKASSGFPSYRDLRHRSNGILIYSNLC